MIVGNKLLVFLQGNVIIFITSHKVYHCNITLLFAFFVVMYSVSSVNEGKYKVLSETLTGVFNAPQRSFQPIEIGDQPRRSLNAPAENVIPPAVTEAPRNPEMDAQARTEALRAMADQLSMEFDELINQGVVSLETSDQWLELNLPNSLLFGSGDAEPHYDAFEVVEKIATVLNNRDNAVKVEGFTDNQPISTSRFPSNWELSSVRATNVVKYLLAQGIEKERLKAAGYADSRPKENIESLSVEQQRQANRRIVVFVRRY